MAAVLSRWVLSVPAVPRQAWWAVAIYLAVALVLLASGSRDPRAAASIFVDDAVTDSYPAAMGAFRQAVAADSTFDLGYYRLSMAADWNGRRTTALWAAELAARYRDRLSDHDRRLVEAYLVQRRAE
jgi:hypothetical protein